MYKLLCEHGISAVLGVQAGVELLAQSHSVCNSEALPGCFAFAAVMWEGSISPRLTTTGHWLFHYNHPVGVKWYCVIVTCISLKMDNIKCPSNTIGMCISSLEGWLCWALAWFLIRCLSFHHWIVRALYKFWIPDPHQICDLQTLCPILWQSLNRMEEKSCLGVSFVCDVIDVTCAYAGSWEKVSISFLDCSGVFYLFLNHSRYCFPCISQPLMILFIFCIFCCR